jgi:LmbE family N-acetylglucosaminyl deacetylase
MPKAVNPTLRSRLADDPAELFGGPLLLTAPQMDDCVLACGGTLARLAQLREIDVVYATDGTASPSPEGGSRLPELESIRMTETKRALAILGVPAENLTFLGLPDGGLSERSDELLDGLTDLIERKRPTCVLAPFRFDRHPDHVALNTAVTAALSRISDAPQLFEYFVYHRWRLLPSGDVRSYIGDDQLRAVDIGEVAQRKRKSLDCFRSQTTNFFDWQTRPVLTPTLLDEFCDGPEYFLRFDPARQDTAIFDRLVPWIRIANRLETRLKRRKDQLLALLK